MTQVLRHHIRELSVPQVTGATLDMQLIVEQLAEGFVNSVSLDDRESPNTIRDLALHRLPLMMKRALLTAARTRRCPAKSK